MVLLSQGVGGTGQGATEPGEGARVIVGTAKGCSF